ncbi:MAG: cache domain-containing protein [Candidatus Contendobacter sp.]|jgi:signal transduction histidine kinase|nr:cache domain-containing protein [Candidatus Contendobacter sp.]
MNKKLMLGMAAFCAMGLTGGAWAAEFGTAAEAKAMLEKAVTAVKADKAKALAAFNSGAEGFKAKDLYVFCGGPDGNFTAHPSLVGKSMKDLKDKNGKPIGEEFYKAAQEGKLAEVSYMWPRPGEEKLSEKVTYFTKAGDQVCGVGYFKQ